MFPKNTVVGQSKTIFRSTFGNFDPMSHFLTQLHGVTHIVGSQLISMVGHKEPKPVQRYMSKGQMNTIALCVSAYFKADKGPTKNGQRARFGLRAAC